MKHLLVALIIGAVPALAHAQPRAPARPGAVHNDCARAKQAGRACKIVFDTADTVDGSRPSAGHDMLTGRSPLRFTTLISVRESFREQIIHSAEDL